jgi:hypothetical protein
VRRQEGKESNSVELKANAGSCSQLPLPSSSSRYLALGILEYCKLDIDRENEKGQEEQRETESDRDRKERGSLTCDSCDTLPWIFGQPETSILIWYSHSVVTLSSSSLELALALALALVLIL